MRIDQHVPQHLEGQPDVVTWGRWPKVIGAAVVVGVTCLVGALALAAGSAVHAGPGAGARPAVSRSDAPELLKRTAAKLLAGSVGTTHGHTVLMSTEGK